MILTIRWDRSMGCYRVNVPEFDMAGTGVEVVPVMDLLTERAIDAAADVIWPLENLSSDEAREELRADVRKALAAAMNVASSVQKNEPR